VLIVCEGEKTEPFYFEGLRVHYGISSVNVRVTPANGSDPVSIVSYALERFDDYDRTYCVFDRDEHRNFDEAIRIGKASNAYIDGRLYLIPSTPCFEVWPLLHYRYSAAEIARVGQRSPGDMAVAELRAYIDDYEKKHRGIFAHLLPRLDNGLRHARQLESENRDTGAVNPATKLHQLVEYLMRIKDTVLR
jgi:hypothetical protein